MSEFEFLPGTVLFIGAGPGALDLLTIRGQRAIGEADLVLYADSLVDPAIATLAKTGARVVGSSAMTLDESIDLMVAAARNGDRVARVHSGDPAIYGAMHEQMVRLQSAGIEFAVVPGVSAAFAAAAAANAELTVPGVAQTVIFTRLASRTSSPEHEQIRDMARTGATLVIFLSAAVVERLVEELRAGDLPDDTPVVVAYRVSWHDERVVRCTVGDLARTCRRLGITRQALFLVGAAVDPAILSSAASGRSSLYSPTHTHLFRKAVGERA
jgi:precorrin-4 C11-methyltransferase